MRNSRVGRQRTPGVKRRPPSEMLGGSNWGSGGGIRTRDLWVMSPTSCHCSTPRYGRTSTTGRWGVRATASPPTRSPTQYSPALAPGTTRFGMVRGGSTPLSATRTPQRLVVLGSTTCLTLPHHRPRPCGSRRWIRIVCLACRSRRRAVPRSGPDATRPYHPRP